MGCPSLIPTAQDPLCLFSVHSTTVSTAPNFTPGEGALSSISFVFSGVLRIGSGPTAQRNAKFLEVFTPWAAPVPSTIRESTSFDTYVGLLSSFTYVVVSKFKMWVFTTLSPREGPVTLSDTYYSMALSALAPDVMAMSLVFPPLFDVSIEVFTLPVPTIATRVVGVSLYLGVGLYLDLYKVYVTLDGVPHAS